MHVIAHSNPNAYITEPNGTAIEFKKPLNRDQADFNRIVISRINRPSRQQNDNVAEEIYYFEYSMKLEIANEDAFQTRTIKVLSYPLSITVHNNQGPKAMGKLLWFNRYPEQDRIHVTEVKQLIDDYIKYELHAPYRNRADRMEIERQNLPTGLTLPLDERQFKYISDKLMSVAERPSEQIR